MAQYTCPVCKNVELYEYVVRNDIAEPTPFPNTCPKCGHPTLHHGLSKCAHCDLYLCIDTAIEISAYESTRLYVHKSCAWGVTEKQEKSNTDKRVTTVALVGAIIGAIIGSVLGGILGLVNAKPDELVILSIASSIVGAITGSTLGVFIALLVCSL